MAIPRPILIALLGLALIAAAFVATRGAGDSGNVVSTATPIAPAPTPKVAPKPAVRPHTTGAQQHRPAATGHKAAPAAKAPAKAAPKAAPKVAAPPLTSAQAEQLKLQRAVTAVNRGDVVVFSFTGSGAADDIATQAAVQTLAGVKGVTVVTAGLNELALYRPVLQSAGVTQVPAVVIARAHQPARVLQGYVDANTLRQTVADARR